MARTQEASPAEAAPKRSLEPALRFDGRVLYLAGDSGLIQSQLAGADLPAMPGQLLDNVSTDEIAPAWACFWYDATLGDYALVGLRGGGVTPTSIRQGGFAVVVSGKSKGCGSSRETAPYAEKAAGIRLVVAESFEKIYRQNCQNIGLHTSTDLSLVARLARGEAITLRELTQGLDPITAGVVTRGGLSPYNLARLAGEVAPPLLARTARPQTLVEKIIARHTVVDAKLGTIGVAAVAPGDAVFCRADLRFTHDYVTAMAASLFAEGFGPDARVREPETCRAFHDHLVLLDEVMPRAQREQGLLALAHDLARVQRELCRAQGITLEEDTGAGAARAICHNAVLDDLAFPGELVVGTDSHTCTAGALGCFALGVGATDMANAWLTRDVRVRVPDTVRIELAGRLGPGVAAKDLMLALMAQPYFKTGQAIGQVLELGGAGLAALGMDERATLANMAVEAGATSAIIPADEVTRAHLRRRGIGAEARALEGLGLEPDPDATYVHRFSIDLGAIEPMVATPGDPRNGVPIRTLASEVPISIAYGGSCTGGKRADMDMYAEVLGAALATGARVKAGVRLYIQFGSQAVKAYAQERGYLDIFTAAGAQLLAPACGACINAGPGVSTRADEVTVAAINRNFPGRSGPGQVYLASPYVVAASAIAGRITVPAARGGCC